MVITLNQVEPVDACLSQAHPGYQYLLYMARHVEIVYRKHQIPIRQVFPTAIFTGPVT